MFKYITLKTKLQEINISSINNTKNIKYIGNKSFDKLNKQYIDKQFNKFSEITNNNYIRYNGFIMGIFINESDITNKTEFCDELMNCIKLHKKYFKKSCDFMVIMHIISVTNSNCQLRIKNSNNNSLNNIFFYKMIINLIPQILISHNEIKYIRYVKTKYDDNLPDMHSLLIEYNDNRKNGTYKQSQLNQLLQNVNIITMRHRNNNYPRITDKYNYYDDIFYDIIIDIGTNKEKYYLIQSQNIINIENKKINKINSLVWALPAFYITGLTNYINNYYELSCLSESFNIRRYMYGKPTYKQINRYIIYLYFNYNLPIELILIILTKI